MPNTIQKIVKIDHIAEYFPGQSQTAAIGKLTGLIVYFEVTDPVTGVISIEQLSLGTTSGDGTVLASTSEHPY